MCCLRLTNVKHCDNCLLMERTGQVSIQAKTTKFSHFKEENIYNETLFLFFQYSLKNKFLKFDILENNEFLNI